MSTEIFWYISRTAGLVAYVLLFFNMFLGLGMKLRFLDKICAKWLAFDLHQFTALVGIALICLHIFSLLGDTYLHFTLPQLLVPGSSSYRAAWTAWGIIGFYAAIIITVSFYVRKFIGQSTWRKIHFISLGFFYVILIHAIKTGTDISLLWVKIMYLVTGLIITFLVLQRLANVLFAAKKGENTVQSALTRD